VEVDGVEVVPELLGGVYEVVPVVDVVDVVVVDVVDSTFGARFIAIASTVPRTKLPFAKLEVTI
jgi:hypothetical protein